MGEQAKNKRLTELKEERAETAEFLETAKSHSTNETVEHLKSRLRELDKQIRQETERLANRGLEEVKQAGGEPDDIEAAAQASKELQKEVDDLIKKIHASIENQSGQVEENIFTTEQHSEEFNETQNTQDRESSAEDQESIGEKYINELIGRYFPPEGFKQIYDEVGNLKPEYYEPLKYFVQECTNDERYYELWLSSFTEIIESNPQNIKLPIALLLYENKDLSPDDPNHPFYTDDKGNFPAVEKIAQKFKDETKAQDSEQSNSDELEWLFNADGIDSAEKKVAGIEEATILRGRYLGIRQQEHVYQLNEPVAVKVQFSSGEVEDDWSAYQILQNEKGLTKIRVQKKEKTSDDPDAPSQTVYKDISFNKLRNLNPGLELELVNEADYTEKEETNQAERQSVSNAKLGIAAEKLRETEVDIARVRREIEKIKIIDPEATGAVLIGYEQELENLEKKKERLIQEKALEELHYERAKLQEKLQQAEASSNPNESKIFEIQKAIIELNRQIGEAEQEGVSFDLAASRTAFIDLEVQYRELNQKSKKENQESRDLKARVDEAKEQYDKTLKKAAQQEYENEKTRLAASGAKTEAEVEEAMREFTATTLLQRYILDEQNILIEQKTESWPPKEKKTWEKCYERWNKLPKWAQVTIPATIIVGTTLVTVGPGALGLGAYMGIRALRVATGWAVAAGTAAGIEKAGSKIIAGKKQKEMASLGSEAAVNDLTGQFGKLQQQYQDILDREVKRSKVKNIAKFTAAIGLGVGSSIGLGYALTPTAAEASGIGATEGDVTANGETSEINGSMDAGIAEAGEGSGGDIGTIAEAGEGSGGELITSVEMEGGHEYLVGRGQGFWHLVDDHLEDQLGRKPTNTEIMNVLIDNEIIKDGQEVRFATPGDRIYINADNKITVPGETGTYEVDLGTREYSGGSRIEPGAATLDSGGDVSVKPINLDGHIQGIDPLPPQVIGLNSGQQELVGGFGTTEAVNLDISHENYHPLVQNFEPLPPQEIKVGFMQSIKYNFVYSDLGNIEDFNIEGRLRGSTGKEIFNFYDQGDNLTKSEAGVAMKLRAYNHLIAQPGHNNEAQYLLRDISQDLSMVEKSQPGKINFGKIPTEITRLVRRNLA